MRKAGFISDYSRAIKGDSIVTVNHNASCNVMYRRDIFLKEGGFLEGLWPGEDVELDYRLKKSGYKLVFNPRAVVYHYRPKDVRSFLRMMYRYGSVQGLLVRRYGIFRRMQIMPFFVLLLTSFLIFATIKSLFFGLALIGAAILLLLAYFNFDLTLGGISLLAFFAWHGGFFRKLLYR